MITHPYAMEKLAEFERERVKRIKAHEPPPRPRRSYGFLRTFGRALRLAGEGLEEWATPHGATSRRDYCPDPKYY